MTSPLRVFPLDEQGDQGDQGREENQRNQGQGKVEGSLDDAFESIHIRSILKDLGAQYRY